MNHFADPLGLDPPAALLISNPVFAPCHITLSARNTLAPRKETAP